MRPTVMIRPSLRTRILAEEPLVLERRSDGRLWALRGEVECPVVVRRCFPWSEARLYVSLRDDRHNEVALIKDPAELSPVSRQVLVEAMAEAGFLFEVTRVLEVEEEVEIRHWTVHTAQGHRTFQTRLDDWPRPLPGGGFLIRDVAGDLYRLPDPKVMDPKSRELLWSFVD